MKQVQVEMDVSISFKLAPFWEAELFVPNLQPVRWPRRLLWWSWDHQASSHIPTQSSFASAAQSAKHTVWSKISSMLYRDPAQGSHSQHHSQMVSGGDKWRAKILLFPREYALHAALEIELKIKKKKRKKIIYVGLSCGLEREKEKRNKTKTLARKEEKTGKEKNKTSCTQQPVSRGGRVCVICIPLLKWAWTAWIQFALLRPSLTFLLIWFCDFSCLFLSSIRRIQGGFRPSLIFRCHFMRAVWHLQAVPPSASLLGWVLQIPDPHWALTDVSSPSPAPRWGVSSEPEAVSCSQQGCEWADKTYRLNWGWLWAWAEKFGCFCICPCENASCSSPPQPTREWNQRGDLVVSAQEAASLQGTAAKVVWTGSLKPELFVLFILRWGGTTTNLVC